MGLSPVLYIVKEECCGCEVCKAICPVHAIKMCEDEQGFLYPIIDINKCIRCYHCQKVCVMKI